MARGRGRWCWWQQQLVVVALHAALENSNPKLFIINLGDYGMAWLELLIAVHIDYVRYILTMCGILTGVRERGYNSRAGLREIINKW